VLGEHEKLRRVVVRGRNGRYGVRGELGGYAGGECIEKLYDFIIMRSRHKNAGAAWEREVERRNGVLNELDG
jgi:hypothetical protein